MPRPLTIATWPTAIREALNARLRATAYSSLQQTTEWLAQQGYATSKSALHIYSFRLCQVDADNKVEAACLLLKSRMLRKAARASSWHTQLAAAIAQLKEATTKVEAIAGRTGPANKTSLLQVVEQLLAIRQSLESLQATPARVVSGE